jgi:hypothetical protein
MKVIAIHQPQFLPWLGYLDKLRRCHTFCLLDTVQYKKNEFQNRNRIKTAQGWQWLTVPVTYRYPQRINEVGVNQTVDWRRQHLQALKTHYRKTLFFRTYIDDFEELYAQPFNNLVETNVASIRLLMRLLEIDCDLVLASSLAVATDHPTGRLAEICRILGGGAYLSGKDGARYMDLDLFRAQGIQVVFQHFNHPVYPQPYGAFEPNLSALDLLFNCGPDSLFILREAA